MPKEQAKYLCILIDKAAARASDLASARSGRFQLSSCCNGSSHLGFCRKSSVTCYQWRSSFCLAPPLALVSVIADKALVTPKHPSLLAGTLSWEGREDIAWWLDGWNILVEFSGTPHSCAFGDIQFLDASQEGWDTCPEWSVLLRQVD